MWSYFKVNRGISLLEMYMHAIKNFTWFMYDTLTSDYITTLTKDS